MSLFYAIVMRIRSLSRIANFQRANSVQLLNLAVAMAPASPTHHSLKSGSFDGALNSETSRERFSAYSEEAVKHALQFRQF